MERQAPLLGDRSPETVNENWKSLGQQYDGRFRVPTPRNVDKRPRPDFVKAYGHNGYFKSPQGDRAFLQHKRHVATMRDRCSGGEKVFCWPTPETPQNLNAHCCNLGHTGLRCGFARRDNDGSLVDFARLQDQA